MPERLSPQEESRYPNLAATGYEKTSNRDPRYNCVAWAAGWETHRWWEPFPKSGQYWPTGVPEGSHVENYMRAFATVGYEPCADGKMEAGFEKIVLYQNYFGLFGHVAKQLPNGKWASKLGAGKDIVHNSVEAFNGTHWTPSRYMRRKLPANPNLPKNLKRNRSKKAAKRS